MLTLTSENPYSGDNFEKKLQANISPSDQGFENKKKNRESSREKKKKETTKFSSEHIKNWVLNLTSKNQSYEDIFERKFQAKLSPSDKSLEKQ